MAGVSYVRIDELHEERQQNKMALGLSRLITSARLNGCARCPASQACPAQARVAPLLDRAHSRFSLPPRWRHGVLDHHEQGRVRAAGLLPQCGEGQQHGVADEKHAAGTLHRQIDAAGRGHRQHEHRIGPGSRMIPKAPIT